MSDGREIRVGGQPRGARSVYPPGRGEAALGAELRPPRLLVIGALPRDDSPVGGTQVSFAELVQRLRKSGAFEVAVIDTSRRASKRSAWLQRAADLGALVATLRGLLVRAGSSDVVMFNVSASAAMLVGPLIALICRAARKPLAVRLFGGNVDLELDRAPRWRRVLVERTLLAAPLVLLQTRALCERLASGRAARQLPTTRDLPRIDRANAARCTRFLFLAQLRPEKGFADAIAAIARAPEGCTLTVAGPPLSELDMRALHESPRVRYIGAVAPRDVPQVMAQHDALVFPSRYDGEGLPGTVIEALQAGLPVIASRWRSLPELVEHERNGLLITPGSIDELTVAMTRLANESALHVRLARGALDTGAQYRADPWHRELEAWLAALCSRARPIRPDLPQPAPAVPRRECEPAGTGAARAHPLPQRQLPS